MPRNWSADAGTGGRGEAGVSEILRDGTQLRLERRTYKASWGMCEMDLVAALEEFVARCAEKENTETPIASKLGMIYIYHEHFVRLSMPLGNPLIESAKQGINKAHVDKGTQQTATRSLPWSILTRMQDGVPSCGAGGRVVSAGLSLFSVFM